MSIRYIEDTRQLILETKNTAYQMKIDELGYLQHSMDSSMAAVLLLPLITLTTQHILAEKFL